MLKSLKYYEAGSPQLYFMKASEYLIIKSVVGTMLALRKGLGVLAGQAGYSLDAFATNSLLLSGT